MSALGTPVLINNNNAYWLSSITNDVVHSTITTQEIDANLARFSTVFVSDQLTTSSLNASSFSLKSLDLSEGYVSTLYTNNIFTSSQTWASDLSGGLGYVKINTDPSGVRVIGDPITFGNLVYFTSTITLVPVSTLIDTDLFAQNGYFSTLSSGSISAGQIRANSASLSTLTVSSITTTDISGFEPETWSLYPTLNSSITFNGSNVLSNIGKQLFFAGTELTDVSGGGANWSLFPAVSDASFNNFSIRQLSTLQYQDGARLYSQTGNNLFYNGQPISYGTQGNAANWSFYPASTNVNMAGFGILSPNKLNLAAPQMSTVIDQGLNLASVASYDVTVGNGNRGTINLTANGGNNNGIFGSVNLTANGATLSGVGATGGLITLTANTPTGTPCNATSAIKFSAAGINSYAGAIPSIASLAGYNFIYGNAGVNIASGIPSVFPNIPLTTYLYGTAGVTTESTFYVPEILPYWNGLTTPPDLVISGRYIAPNLAQVYLQLSNVKLLSMDAGATINNARQLNFSNATGQISGLSTINGIPLSQIQTPSNIFCSNLNASISTSATVMIAQSSITNVLTCSNRGTISSVLFNECFGFTGSISSLRVNTLNVISNINAISGGGPIFTRINNFSSINSFNMSTTDFWVSSINGQPFDLSGGGGTINNFSTLSAGTLAVSSIKNNGFITIEDPIQFIGVNPGAITKLRTINTDQSLDLDIIANRINLGAFNVFAVSMSTNNANISSLRTSSIETSSIVTRQVQTSSILGFGGLPIAVGNSLDFIAPNAVNNVAVINTNSLAIPQLNIAASTINLQAANTAVTSLSSLRHQAISSQILSLSTGNLSTSALQFSTAVSIGSNTAFNYPLLIDWDQAGSASAGVGLAIQGHSYGTGAVINRLEMGARGNGNNYIMSVWPGHNLEDLYIDATEVIFNDGNFSTIVNLDPYGLITNGSVSTQGLLVSSINGYAAGPAFTNNLMTSTMELYAASTTLMYWDSTTTSDNINTTGYDAVVGINGNYKIGASFQFISGGATDEVEFFILKNDAVISQSGGIIELQNNAELVTYVESIESLANGDKIQIGCYTANSNVFVSTINGNVIQSPACILTMYKVDS